jgi:hypothetical protein
MDKASSSRMGRTVNRQGNGGHRGYSLVERHYGVSNDRKCMEGDERGAGISQESTRKELVLTRSRMTCQASHKRDMSINDKKDMHDECQYRNARQNDEAHIDANADTD